MRHITIRQGVQAPAASMERDIQEEVKKFLTWWINQCKERGLEGPSMGGGASYVIIGRMLGRHTLEELKKLGVLMFLDHGEELRGYSHHFVLMASKLDQLKEEEE